jgi:hypothetical protein
MGIDDPRSVFCSKLKPLSWRYKLIIHGSAVYVVGASEPVSNSIITHRLIIHAGAVG